MWLWAKISSIFRSFGIVLWTIRNVWQSSFLLMRFLRSVCHRSLSFRRSSTIIFRFRFGLFAIRFFRWSQAFVIFIISWWWWWCFRGVRCRRWRYSTPVEVMSISATDIRWIRIGWIWICYVRCLWCVRCSCFRISRRVRWAGCVRRLRSVRRIRWIWIRRMGNSFLFSFTAILILDNVIFRVVGFVWKLNYDFQTSPPLKVNK